MFNFNSSLVLLAKDSRNFVPKESIQLDYEIYDVDCNFAFMKV
jgi:hypothetical protein